jgi:hypothetical protein
MIRKWLLAAAVVFGSAAIAADLKSGPQPGEKMPGPFHPKHLTGEDAGEEACLYCKFGDSPVVAVFARTADDPNLLKLIAAIDAATDRNRKAEMGSYVIYLSTESKLESKLKEQAATVKYKQVVLAVMPDGPAKYHIAADADVTVLLYKERVVVANFAFAKGKLAARDVETIAAAAAKW